MEGQSGDSREDSPNNRDTRSSSYRGQRYSGGGGGGGSGGGGGAGIVPGGRGADFPLRILVPSDMVGAIIGRSGGTIRNITQETRARVDVHRKENSGSSEKVITIYGNAENCSKACQKIMEVMQKEANNTNKDEIPLKILAYNNLIGRIIGKNGNTIKRIMEQTETKITVSTNIHDVNSFNLERIITIEGRLKDICAAEQIISSKLRQSYESDLAMLASPQTMMFPGLHPMAMMSTLGSHNYPPARGAPAPGPSSFGMYGSPSSFLPPAMPYASNAPPPITSAGPGASPLSSLPQEQIKETVYLYIPNVAVGAIIGTGGSTIREMISSSGASIKVAQSSKEEHQQSTVAQGTAQTESPAQSGLQSSQPSTSQSSERKLTIIGAPEAQWKAQFMIFRKVGYEGLTVPQEATLKVEIMVPSSQVGRIIGKGGSVVRDLQRLTHAMIKLPEESQSSSDETPVHIIGDFLSTQAAQRQIRALVARGIQPSKGVRSSRLKSTQSPVHPNHSQQHIREGTSQSFTPHSQEKLGEESVSQSTTTPVAQTESEQEQQSTPVLSESSPQ